MPPSKQPSSGPLVGVKILDLTSVIMGPFATQLLAEMGAEVIKLESPDGDIMRHVGPMKHDAMGHIFLHANAGKQSIVLNLKHPDGLEAALTLAQDCDVLISNVRPQAMARLGLDYEAVYKRNPRIIHVSCCGFDQDGPDAALPAYDDLIQGATCIPWLMEQHGSPYPTYVPTTLADRVTGLHAVYAVTAALFSRERTGKGQAIIVPMFEAMSQFILGDHMGGLTFTPPQGGPGYARLLTSHRKPYKTKDGILCVLIYNDKHWKSFFQAIGEENGVARDPKFSNHAARAANINAVYEYVEREMLTRTTAEWQHLLNRVDVPNMPMNTPADLIQSPQLRKTGFIHEIEHPSEGTLSVMTHPSKWSATPPNKQPAPAPRLGEHTRSILEQAGFSPQQIDAMLIAGAAFEASK